MSPPLPVSASWYSVTEVDPGVLLITEPHVVRLFRGNFFLVRGETRDLLFDTGVGIGDLPALLHALGARDPILFTSHTHIDHIGGHAAVAASEVLVHPAEAALLRDPPGPQGLAYERFPLLEREQFRAAGFDTSGLLIDALPRPGYDPLAWRARGRPDARLVSEGEVIDLGQRRLRVLHLPGHSPGSIALWDAADGMLIAGDAIYDGVLVDTLAGADIPAYRATMRRLRDLPVRIVHGGHRASFGRERMRAIADEYLASRAAGPAAPPAATISF